MSELREVGDSVSGEKLAAVGRKIGRVIVISGTGAPRAQRVYIWGIRPDAMGTNRFGVREVACSEA